MMKLLTAFAALAMAGTTILSLLPDGSLKRTAGMAVGLITLMCWAEGIALLLQIDQSTTIPPTVFVPTSVNVQLAEAQAANTLIQLWEDTP